MDAFYIEGSRNFFDGEIFLQGSKNASLPILAASILTNKEIVLQNVPEISDVRTLLDILQSIGVVAQKSGGTLIVQTEQITNTTITGAAVHMLRSSVFLLGAMLSRAKKVTIAYPGGCDIGLRPVDMHIGALRRMGVLIEEDREKLVCDGKDMHAADITLPYPSVGATENILMAAVFVKGITTIKNVAQEPEIVALASFLGEMGARIKGAGSKEIQIEGVNNLTGTEYTIPCDRIALGTYLLLILTKGGNVSIKNVLLYGYDKKLFNMIKSCCKTQWSNDIINISSKGERMKSFSISTGPYPGFSTDLQAPLSVAATVGSGNFSITETIFENRFRHMTELAKMGAKIETEGRCAHIEGVERLTGAIVSAQDLRGGAALVNAGLLAEGMTIVKNAHYIDRGYAAIENVYKNIGANISRG